MHVPDHPSGPTPSHAARLAARVAGRRRLLRLALAGAMPAASSRRVAADTAPAGGRPPPPPRPGFVSVLGRRFVGPDGQAFPVRGINLGNWLIPEGYMMKFTRAKSPREINALFEWLVGREAAARFWQRFREHYVTRDDIAFIRACGFNTVRVPLHWGLFVADDGDPSRADGVAGGGAARRGGPPRFEGPGWPLLDRVIGWAGEAGLKVIIDLHAAPGGQTGVNHDDGAGIPLVFYVPAYRRLTVDLWREIARRYRDEPAVLGYDLMNEPISPYTDVAYLNPRLEPLYREITEAIRAVDADHVIFYAAAQWSTNFDVFGPPYARQVAYTYHKFWASPSRNEVQSYLNFADRWQVPVFLGETGELTDEWNRNYRELNERFGIGWAFWTYKNMDSGSTVVSIERPPGWADFERLAALPPARWAGARGPSRDQAQATLDAYLEAMKLANARINPGYIRSLGLSVPDGAPPARTTR